MSSSEGAYTPLSLSGTITSESGYTYSNLVLNDQYVDVQTYSKTDDESRPYVLESAVSIQEQAHLREEFVEKFNSTRTADERRTMRNYFFRHIFQTLRSSKSLHELNNFLNCEDKQIRCRVVQTLQNKLLKVNIENEDVQSILQAASTIATCIVRHWEENKEDGVPLLADLMVVLQVKERTALQVKSVQKERHAGVKETHDIVSKACKKCKDPVLSSLSAFIGKCLKHKMTKHGMKLIERWNTDSIDEAELHTLIHNIHTCSAIEIHLLLLALIYKVNVSVMPTTTAENFIKMAHARLNYVGSPIDKDAESSRAFLAHFILRGMAYLFERKFMSCQQELVKESLMKAIQCIRSPKSMFSMLPLDVISMVLRIDARDSFSIWSNISLADGEFQRMVSQHAEAQIPGLVLQRGFPLEKQIVGKRSDHAVWLRVKGTFMSRHEVDVMIFVTGRYPTRLKVTDQEDIEFGNTETEFDILRSIQYRQQHRNVAQLLAFCDPNPRSFAMFAVEKYECTLLKYLYAARSNNEELKLKWKVKRCLEMLNAIDFLHFHKIVHRDIMADVFSMRYNGPDPEVLVLTSFKRAIANDEAGNTTMIGHVRDLNSTQIPTRWSAPESFLQDRFDTYSDIWMLGHAIREIFTCGCQPYTEMYSEDTGDIMAKVIFCGLRPHKWRCIPKTIHLITKECFEKDPAKRPTISRLYKSLENIRTDTAKPKRRSGSIGSSRNSFYPTLSEDQQKNEPERGIPRIVQELRKQIGDDQRLTYIGMRYQNRNNRNEYTVSDGELYAADTPTIRRKGDKIMVKEPVSKFYYEKVLGKMSEDFALKNQIQKWPLNPIREDEQNLYPFKLEYECPHGENLLTLAQQPLSRKQHLTNLFEVSKLMDKMHDKHWILVDVCAQNFYLSSDSQQVFMPRIGRMLRLELPFDPDDDVVLCPVVHSNRIHWQPLEVIRNSEYSKDSDVYMLAMVFYEYYTAVGLEKNDNRDPAVTSLACVPFASVEINQILCNLLDGEIPLRPPECPLWLYEDIMIPCWSQERTSRPSTKQIVKMISERVYNYNMSLDADTPLQSNEYDHNYLRDHANGKSSKPHGHSGTSSTSSGYSSDRSRSSNLKTDSTASSADVKGVTSEENKDDYLTVQDSENGNFTTSKPPHDLFPKAKRFNNRLLTQNPAPTPHHNVHKENPLFQSTSNNDASGSSTGSSSSGYNSISPRDTCMTSVPESVRREQHNFTGDSSLFQSSFSDTSAVTFVNASEVDENEESDGDLSFANDSDDDDE